MADRPVTDDFAWEACKGKIRDKQTKRTVGAEEVVARLAETEHQADHWCERANAAEAAESAARQRAERAEQDLREMAGRYVAAETRNRELAEALRWMADYKMTGSERTLHIDFQGKARAVLASNPETRPA